MIDDAVVKFAKHWWSKLPFGCFVLVFAIWVLPIRALGNERVLLLGVSEDEAYSPMHTVKLEAYLDKRGILASSQGLTLKERSDHGLENVERLAKGRAAGLAMWATVKSLPDHRKRVEFFLFDVRTNADRTDSVVCPDELLAQTLTDLCSKVLSAADSPSDLAEAPVRPPPIAPPVRLRAVERPLWRKALAASLAIAGGGALAAAIVLTVQHGQLSGNDCYTNRFHHSSDFSAACRNNYIAGFSVGYSAAALLGVGAWLSLELPERSRKTNTAGSGTASQ